MTQVEKQRLVVNWVSAVTFHLKNEHDINNWTIATYDFDTALSSSSSDTDLQLSFPETSKISVSVFLCL